MSYNIALNFEDGVTRVITCNEGETVLDAAYRAQINLPMDCSDGVCGTCKGSCHQGEFDMGDEYIDEALSDEEAAQGMVLTCQMRSEEHTSELQSRPHLVCRLLLEKKKKLD